MKNEIKTAVPTASASSDDGTTTGQKPDAGTVQTNKRICPGNHKGAKACPSCNGKKKVQCNTCDGTAELVVNCGKCKGSGVDLPCSRCRGTGQHPTLSGNYCNFCRGSGSELKECREWGRGWKWFPGAPCPACMGHRLVVSKCPDCHNGKKTCPTCDGAGYKCSACDKELSSLLDDHRQTREKAGLLALSIIGTDPSKRIWTKDNIPEHLLTAFFKRLNDGGSIKKNPREDKIVAYIDNSMGFFDSGVGMLLTNTALKITYAKDSAREIDLGSLGAQAKKKVGDSSGGNAYFNDKYLPLPAGRAEAIELFIKGVWVAASALQYKNDACSLFRAGKPSTRNPKMEALLDTIKGEPKPPIVRSRKAADPVKPATEEPDVVATGSFSRKASTEVPSMISGVKKDAPVKPVARIKEKPSPKKIQAGVVKSANSAPDDESAIRFSVWSTFREGPFCPEMVVLPAGTFMMGSNDHESEQPLRQIELKLPFCMGKYPVTCEEYDKFLEANVGRGFDIPDNNREGRGRCPVSGVSWTDAQAYCEWLSKVTKGIYRLPSEAEWEYAARAGTTTRYWWGNDVKEGGQYYGPKLPPGETTLFGTVGSFAPNPWGIYDLLGSVEQWCQDIHDINNEFTPLDGSPRFNSLTHKKIQGLMDRLGDETFFDEKRIRGGRIDSLGKFEIKTLSENRQRFYCDGAAYQGFRVVREI